MEGFSCSAAANRKRQQWDVSFGGQAKGQGCSCHSCGAWCNESRLMWIIAIVEDALNQVLSIVPHDLLVLLVSMLMVDVTSEVYAFTRGLSLGSMAYLPTHVFPPLRTRSGVARELYGTGFGICTPHFSWIWGFARAVPPRNLSSVLGSSFLIINDSNEGESQKVKNRFLYLLF